MDTTSDILDAARAALERESAGAAACRGVDPSDPRRRAALQALLEELISARDPLLPHLRGAGRLAGAGRNPTDPIRVTHRELTAAIRRCRSRLAPTSGTPYKRVAAVDVGTPANRRAVANRAYNTLRGTLSEAEGQSLPALAARHEEHVRMLGRGDGFKGMATFREESRALVDRINEIRTRLRQRLAQYERVVAELKQDAADAHADGRGSYPTRYGLYRKHADRLVDLTARAGRLEAAVEPMRARLYRASRRRRAIPTAAGRRNDWRYGGALAAVLGFCDEHGRMPTKRECNGRRDLPPYTTLRREFGRSPFAQLDRLRNESHK